MQFIPFKTRKPWNIVCFVSYGLWEIFQKLTATEDEHLSL